MKTNNLKSISKTDNELRVANYIILFGGKDLTDEFFTKSTKIESSYTDSGLLHVDFEHGLDPDGLGLKSNDIFGVVDWKTAKIDDTGVFVERVLNRRAKYMNLLESMIDDGVVGTSSMAVPNTTRKNADTGEITVWPLYRDSLTFTPAEPRMLSQNTLNYAKSLYQAIPESKSLNKFFNEEKDIKMFIENSKSLKDFETILRDAGSFSRTDATMFVGRIKSFVRGELEQELKLREEIKNIFAASILTK